MPFATLQHLPAAQWKLINLRKLKTRNPGRFSAQHDERHDSRIFHNPPDQSYITGTRCTPG